MEKLLLIDGNSLINRAYYAFGTAGAGELSFGGMPTNATYGFLNMFVKAVSDIKPTHIIVAWDMRAKTFRHKLFSGYKAQRKGMPDDLAVQFEDLKKILTTAGVAQLSLETFEADDIIGAVAKKVRGVMPVVILSADRDGLQLVDDNIELHLTKTGVSNLDVWTKTRIQNEMGVNPTSLIDIKALMGDKSDNILGAAGIGEKTAFSLIQKFGSIEKLYERIDEISGATKEKLLASKEMVFLSKVLATINISVPIIYDIENAKFSLPFADAVRAEFKERGFNTLLKRENLWSGNFKTEEEKPKESPEPRPQPRKQEVIVKRKFEPKNIVLKNIDEIKKVLERAFDKIAIVEAEGGMQFAFNELENFVTEYSVDLFGSGLDEIEVYGVFKSVLEGETPKFLFDSKSLKEKLLRQNIRISNVVLDAKIADHLLKTRVEVKDLGDLFLSYGLETNAFAAAIFFVDFFAKMRAQGLTNLYENAELPLVDILIEMQQNGVQVNLDALNALGIEYNAKLVELSDKIFEIIGERFNINSPKILGGILAEKLELRWTKKTKGGDKSVDEDVLISLKNQHEVIEYILEYRKFFKLYSSYIQSYSRLADERGLIHSSYNNTAVVTGRLSSSNPNLQTIPKRGDESDKIRAIFKSRFDGGVLVSADYSQIELRLLAHFSGDENMISAFRSGRDIHTETAMKVFGVPAELVSRDMRRRAKAVNFGIVYGISAFGLSNDIGVSPAEAGEFIKKYFEAFPKVAKCLDNFKELASQRGYAETLFGRRRYIPELTNLNHNIVKFGLRAAVNMPMQGSASDIIKFAMIKIAQKLNGKKSLLVMQVHDELILDCEASEANEIAEIVKREMESVIELKVPLAVDVEISKTL
ncbi:MAG: DNA polymerase I [Christensenellaceae bacterium]|jgi:DNA polymerase-1|nr:DNA polymerase I [Christensenellaceae bacterium]